MKNSERRHDRDTAVHQTAHEDHSRRMAKQQHDLFHHRKARSDPNYRVREQQANNARCQQVRGSTQASFRVLNYYADDFHNTTDLVEL